MNDAERSDANIELVIHLATLARSLADLGREIDMAVNSSLDGEFVYDNVSLIVVCKLEVDGPMRPSEIVGVTGLSSGGATKTITRLENAGMVERIHGAFPADRRGVSVQLTARGHEFAHIYATQLGTRLATLPELASKVTRLLEPK
jgi:DNA-binding MarR family transcriptional regulator